MDPDGADDLTLRPNAHGRAAYCVGWGLAVAVVGFLVIVLVNAVWESTAFLAVGTGLILVAIGGIVWRAARSSVRLNDAGVRVVAPLRSLTLDWAEVREITFEQRTLLSSVFVPAPAFTWPTIRGQRELVVRTHAGARVAARSTGATTPLERDAARSLASRHGVVVDQQEHTALLGRH